MAAESARESIRYIRWAQKNGELNELQAGAAHQLAEKYVGSISKELAAGPSVLKGLAGLPHVRMFALDDEMLDLANQLALTKSRPETLRPCHSGWRIGLLFQTLEARRTQDPVC